MQKNCIAVFSFYEKTKIVTLFIYCEKVLWIIVLFLLHCFLLHYFLLQFSFSSSCCSLLVPSTTLPFEWATSRVHRTPKTDHDQAAMIHCRSSQLHQEHNDRMTDRQMNDQSGKHNLKKYWSNLTHYIRTILDGEGLIFAFMLWFLCYSLVKVCIVQLRNKKSSVEDELVIVTCIIYMYLYIFTNAYILCMLRYIYIYMCVFVYVYICNV